jgi:hypothetical protein
MGRTVPPSPPSRSWDGAASQMVFWKIRSKGLRRECEGSEYKVCCPHFSSQPFLYFRLDHPFLAGKDVRVMEYLMHVTEALQNFTFWQWYILLFW